MKCKMQIIQQISYDIKLMILNELIDNGNNLFFCTKVLQLYHINLSLSNKPLY